MKDGKIQSQDLHTQAYMLMSVSVDVAQTIHFESQSMQSDIKSCAGLCTIWFAGSKFILKFCTLSIACEIKFVQIKLTI